MKRVSSQAIWQTFLTNLTIQVCNVITGVLTARILLPDGRGELTAIILWPTILGGLGILGTNWALTREAAAHPEKEADLARAAVVLGVVQAALFMVLGYFLVPHLLPADKQHLINLAHMYLIFLPLNFVCLNLLALDHGGLRWKRYNLLRLSVVLPYLLCILGFWLAQVTQVAWFIMALLLSNLITVAFCLYVQRAQIRQGLVRLVEALHILKRGVPFFLAAASGIAALQVDKALGVSLLSSEAVGCYAAAFTFASAHGALGGALGVTSFAALANEPDPCAQGRYLARVFRQASLLYVGAGSAVALLAPLGIVPLFGRDFAPAVVPAAILSLATSCNALGQVLNEGLRGRGSTAPGIAGQLLGGGMVALAAWVWVPSYGLKGLAWAAVCGSLVQLLVLLAAVLVLLPLKPVDLWGLRREEVKLLLGRLLALWPAHGALLKELK
jgi:O-antigen/teichoic acid export membrane protein